MELSIIVICGTVIIVTLFVFMLFKDKSGGEVEWDATTGKLKLKKASSKVHSKVDNYEELSETYKNKKVDDYIEKLKVYKDMGITILSAAVEVRANLYKFLRENNITAMGFAEYEVYTREKIALIFSTYDSFIKKAKNPIINNLSIDFLLDTYKSIIKSNLSQAFNKVYKNHQELNEKRKEFIKLLTSKTEDRAELYNLLFSQVYKDINAGLDIDESLFNEILLDLNNILIGLWHDYLLEYIKKEK